MRKISVLPVFTFLVIWIGVLPASAAETPSSTADQASGSPSAEQTLSQKADAFMKGVLQADNFSGVVLIARNGKVLFAQPYGMANFELDVPNTLDTKFRLASITKQFTAAAILILQERGRLSVNDLLCTYLHDCPSTWKAITIHQLLTQSSGIYSFTESPENEKYEDFMRENIYERLHMENSGYDHSWIILKHRAQGYAVKDGSAVNAAYMYMDTPFGGGSTYSTVGDLLLWDQALYGEKLLSRASIIAMFSPNSAKVPPEWLVGEKGGYGYGWMIEELFGRKLYVHGGLINGFSSIIMRYPEDRTLVVVLRNQQEDFPGELKKLKIVGIGKDLSAIAFGLNPPIATNR